MTKRVVAVIAAMAISFNVSAQNARVDALGGINIMGDMSTVTIYPSDMNDYADQIQGTGTSSTYGPIIGIKAVGDVFRIGSYVDKIGGTGSSVLRSDFYSDALGMVISLPDTPILIGTSNLNSAFLPIPHILLGVDLNAITIGLDLFIENSKYSTENENAMVTPNTTSKTVEKISNIGGILSIGADIGPLKLIPRFGVYLPRYSALLENTFTTGDEPNTKQEIKTDGFALLGAADLIVEAGKTNIAMGASITMENYKFKYVDDIGNDTSYYNDHKFDNLFVDAYAGFYKTLANDLLITSTYSFGVVYDKNVWDISGTGTNTKNTTLSHLFAFGLERPFDGKKFLDTFTPRGGITYSIKNNKSESVRSGGSKNDTKINSASDNGTAAVTAGFGVTRGIATFDMACDILSWGYVFNGPDVVSATLTLDFKKNNKVKNKNKEQVIDAYSAPAPAYEPESATDAPSPSLDATEETSSDSFDF